MPLRRFFVSAALIVVVGTGASAAAAAGQEFGGSPLDMRLAKIARLEPNRGIRIWLPEGNRIDGRFIGSLRDTLIIATDTRTVRVPLNLVDVLWIRQRATAKGAKIGGISGTLVGAALGGLIAIFIQSDCDTGDCGGDALRAVGGMSVLGAAGGTALGAVIGSRTWEWDRRYEGRP
jgi:hypothetical protein